MCELISRRAAIDAVNGMPDCPNGYSDTYDKRHIIAVLEDVPSAVVGTQMSSANDTISRQAAIDALGEREELDDSWTDEYEVGRFQQWKDDVEVLKKLPAVQTKQRLIPCEKCWHGCPFPIHAERRQDE